MLAGVLLGEDVNLLAVDDEVAAIFLNIGLEASMNGVVLEEIDQIVKVHERIVDGGDLSVVALEGGSEDKSSDSSETVNTNSWVRHEGGLKIVLFNKLDMLAIIINRT